jgi:serine/threonine-protein kinase
VDARHLYAIFLLHLGRVEESITELTQVLAADPLLSEANFTLGRACMKLRQAERAIGYLRDATSLQPGFFLARAALGHAYLQHGAAALAIAEFEQAAAMGSSGTAAQLAYGYARVGRTGEAQAIVDRLTAGEGDLPPFEMAMASMGLGRPSEALGWLERGALLRDAWTTSVDSHPAFEPIRNEPRYGALLRTLGLRV